ncbi:MAG: hypothetical protein U0930_01815 [Pirellulales bacterium]
MNSYTKICCQILTGIVQVCLLSFTYGDDWMTWPSTYTHDKQGVRVDQYAMPVEPIGPDRSSYQRSGYRHFRSTLQAGQSADNYHVVEQFGAPVVPYEQWRFPFRPYGVPYDAWGPQTPMNMINASGNYFGYGYGYPNPPTMPGTPGTGTGTGTGTGSTPAPPVVPGYPPGYPPGYGPYYGSGPYGPGMGGQYQPFGFPLQPQYQNQPWFDGSYRDAPPLDNRSDRQFFWNPPR